MKVDAVTLLEGLEARVDKQANSLDLAQNLDKLAQSFDSLLKTMDALYQVSARQGLLLCLSATPPLQKVAIRHTLDSSVAIRRP
jgi:hypothetical protein